MRRRAAALLLAAAAVAPAVVWLAPALASRQAPVFRDQGDFFFPLKLWTADRLKAGEVPLWNPLSGGGEPWLANGQSGPFYPPTWLFLLSSPALAAALFLLLHFVFGAAGTWRFLQAEDCTVGACALGATAFAGCGYAASLSAFWNHFGAWCWLPAIALLARSGLRRRRQIAWLALAVGLQAMAGSPEMSLASISLAVALAAFPRPAAPAPDGWRQEPEGRPLLRVSAAMLLGLALAAWVLFPLTELTWNSSRRGPLPGTERNLGALTAPAWTSSLGLPAAGPASTWVHSIYFGAALLFSAAAAWAERERRRLVLLLSVAAIVGLLLASSGAPGEWLRLLPPLDRFRYPAKFAGLAAFAVAVLGGLGADALRFRRVPARVLAAGGLLAVGLAALASQPIPARLAGTVAAAALLGSALAITPERLRAILPGLCAIALAVTFAISGRPLFAFAPEGELRRVATAIPFLRTVGGRVLTPPMGEIARWALVEDRYGSETLARQRAALLGYTNLLAGVPILRTAAPLPTTIATEVAQAVDDDASPRGSAGAAGARVLWTPFLPPEMGSRKVGEFYRAPIEPWRPRISFSTRVVVEPDAHRARERSLSGASDYRRQISIDRPGPPTDGRAGRSALFVASLLEDRPERVAFSVENGAAGYLVLADTHFPGWRVETDGKNTDLYLADGMFRAVHLTPGSHRIVFSYRPLSVLIGAAVSVAALVSIALLAASRRPRSGRPA